MKKLNYSLERTPRKILIVTGIFPPDIGGPASYVPQIATALAKRGHEITVLTLSDQLYHDDSIYPFHVLRLLRGTIRPLKLLKTIWSIIRLGHSVDVLFANGLFLETILANIVLRKPLVQKVVGDWAWERATSWGLVKDSFEDFQKKRYSLRVEFLKALRAWWTRKADKVIVPSRYLARWVAQWGGPEEKIAVIYNAVELFNGIQPAEVPLKTPVKIVTAGRLIPLKRMDKLIEAVAQLNGVGLIIIGDGPERKHLEELSQNLGVADRVYFAGQKSRGETLALMAACDVFVLNSAHEGLPHVLLEAMALGLSVVATKVGGIPEVIKNNTDGILIDHSGGNLSSVLRDLMLNRTLQITLQQNAVFKVQHFFNIENMVYKTENLLIASINVKSRHGRGHNALFNY